MAEQGARLGAARRWWPLAEGVILGLLAGLLVSLLASGTRHAEASVLISSPAGPSAVKPQLPNLRELATSSVVAGNVRSTLRLTESSESVRRHLHASVRPGAQVIAVSAADSVADHARQLAQEAAVVFAQLVEARFGSDTPQLHAAVLDSAHVLGGPDRHFARNLLVGGIVGLFLGSAAGFLLAGRAPRPIVVGVDDSDLRRREELLERRVSSVSARERALAAHAGKLTAREQELETRVAKLEASDRELAAEAEAPPAPPAAPPLPAEPLRAGGWNIDELQSIVDAKTASASPEQAEEWRAYLFFLREHAAHDGALPRSLDGLLSEVFGELVD